MSQPDAARADRLAMRYLARNADHAVLVLDPQGRVIGWLGAAERMLGYGPEETHGHTADNLFTPRDRSLGMPEHELAVAASGGTSTDDRWHVRRDGTRVWITGAVGAVHDDDGSLAGFVKLMRDRTDLRTQFDNALSRLAEQQDTSAARGRALDTLGHEMRTPLGAIGHAAQAIARAGVPDAVRPALQVIERQLNHLQRLADDMLELTRARHGALEAHYEPVELNRLVDEAVQAVRAGFEAKRIDCRVLLPPAPIELPADPARVRQIVSNLLDNALKYTPAGGTVWVKTSVEARHAVIRVEDTGIGVAPHLLGRIFEMFARGDGGRAASGVGIGLALVKQYAELHCGTAEVRSAGENKGSEFSVHLPLERQG
jgi:PAS domain S-box-containing protein